MEMLFTIVVNMRMPMGMLEIGNFLIGDDYDFARNTFRSLRGNIGEADAILRIDLVKRLDRNEIEVLASKGCTLNEYVWNSRLIARDVFRFFAMERP